MTESSKGITIMGLTVSEDAAAKMEQVQTAALYEAEKICQGRPLQPLAAQYIQGTNIATDSCQKFTQFAGLAMAGRDALAAAQMFRAHAMDFGCRDLSVHKGMVVGLAKNFLTKGGIK